ncbi:MAG TPA: mycofactocin-coupled SDR family oxidoreductase [Acidimicrobiales bacterium]|nr:mycofactocin-coupled SDR family oxidoreductase [Acidimicrobiales bacterium]
MSGRLEGKVAFITGAARGQGRSHAVLLASEGADVIGVDISAPVPTVPYPTATADDLAETVRLVERVGGRILAAEADVRDLAAMAAVVDEGVSRFGGLDIILANAGISSPAPTLEMSEETWATTIDINLTGVWKTVRASAHHMIAADRGGSIVITSSLAAMKASEHTAHYTASKAGLVGLMRVLAKELAPHRIRVNTLHPTNVFTDMILNDALYRLFRPDLESPTRADFELAAQGINALPVAATDPVDISNAVLYLVSDEGRYVTGATFVIDAGASL